MKRSTLLSWILKIWDKSFIVHLPPASSEPCGRLQTADSFLHSCPLVTLSSLPHHERVKSIFLPLNLSCACDLLWPTECDRSDEVPVPNPRLALGTLPRCHINKPKLDCWQGVFPVVMYGCDSRPMEKGWVRKNWCCWTVVLEKTLESLLDCRQTKPVNPKGNQPWIFTRRTDAEAGAPILWPPDGKSWTLWKRPWF